VSCQYFDNSNQICLINQLSYNTEVNGYQGYSSSTSTSKPNLNSSLEGKQKPLNKLDYEQQQNLLNQYKLVKKKQRSEKSLAQTAEQTTIQYQYYNSSDLLNETSASIIDQNISYSNQSINNNHNQIPTNYLTTTNKTLSHPNIMSTKNNTTKSNNISNEPLPTSPVVARRQSRRTSSNNNASSPNSPKEAGRTKSTSILKRFSFKFKSSSQGPDKSSSQSQSNTTLNNHKASANYSSSSQSNRYTSTPTSPQLPPRYSSNSASISTPQSPRVKHYIMNPIENDSNATNVSGYSNRQQESSHVYNSVYNARLEQERASAAANSSTSESTNLSRESNL
jgi:hypothetical protein